MVEIHLKKTISSFINGDEYMLMYRIGCYTLIFLQACHLSMNANKLSDAQMRILNEIMESPSPRTFVLSFPRSGNTWLRYCLEFLTQRPSLAYYGLSCQPRQRTLGWSADFPVDHRRAPIIKAHRAQEMVLHHNDVMREPNPDTDTLILILRNPKECFARHQHQSWHSLLLNAAIGLGYEPRSYFDNINYFETWPSHMRLLVYYEDLIIDPRTTLTRILTFLKEPTTHLDQFMNAYEEHVQKCLVVYGRNTSKRNDIFFHSKKTSHAYHMQIDNWITAAYPHVWTQYLQRYTT